MTQKTARVVAEQLSLFPLDVEATVREQMMRKRLTDRPAAPDVPPARTIEDVKAALYRERQTPFTFSYKLPAAPAPLFNTGLSERGHTIQSLGDNLSARLTMRIADEAPHRHFFQGTVQSRATHAELQAQKHKQELIGTALELAHRLDLTQSETLQMIGLNPETDSRREKLAIKDVFGIDLLTPSERFRENIKTKLNTFFGTAHESVMVEMTVAAPAQPLSSQTMNRLEALADLDRAMALADRTVGPQDWANLLRTPTSLAPFGQKVELERLMAISEDVRAQNGIDLLQDFYAPTRPLDFLLKAGNDAAALPAITAVTLATDALARQATSLPEGVVALFGKMAQPSPMDKPLAVVRQIGRLPGKVMAAFR